MQTVPLAEEYNQQGKTLVSMGNPEKALAYFARAEQEDPLYRPTYMNQGEALILLDRFEEARAAYEKALTLNRKDGEVLFHLGNVAYLAGDAALGRAHYAKAVALGYDGADLYMNQGYLAAEDGRLDEAVERFDKAIARDPFHQDAWMGKAKAYLQLGKTNEGLRALSSMLEALPEALDAHHLRIATLLQLGKFAQAEQALSFARRVYPDNVTIMLDTLLLLEAQGKSEEALRYLDEHFGDTQAEELLLERGRILSGLPGREAEALACFMRVSEGEDPSCARDAAFSAMLLYIQQKDARAALALCERLLEGAGDASDPFAGTALYLRGFLYAKLEDTQASLRAYEQAIERLRLLSAQDPGRAELYLLRGFCYLDTGAFSKALEMTDFLLSAQPGFTEALYLRGCIHRAMGEHRKADADFSAVKASGGISSAWLGELGE